MQLLLSWKLEEIQMLIFFVALQTWCPILHWRLTRVRPVRSRWRPSSWCSSPYPPQTPSSWSAWSTCSTGSPASPKTWWQPSPWEPCLLPVSCVQERWGGLMHRMIALKWGGGWYDLWIWCKIGTISMWIVLWLKKKNDEK